MKIVNSMTSKKEEFIPLNEGKVNMYACGPTVYNYFHIGNARPFIVFDTLRRYLEYRGYDVNFVQNFTDIDDKMIEVANNEGITVKELADRFIAEYFCDAKSLNILPANIHPKATEHIEDIIALIEKLIDSGYAYQSGNDVYYSTNKFADYGKLSGQNLEEVATGVRKDLSQNKKHPTDFVLWKSQKPGEPAWESPWGMGRPGWHIECSAMSMKYLGDTIDIHGGGQDLKFPHHENEIAQSEAASGKQFSKYWMHNGYINIDGSKMSKSAGNFFTVRDIIAKYDGLVVRLFMLSAHYANPVNFSDELLEQAKSAYGRIGNCRENLSFIMNLGNKAELNIDEEITTFKNNFVTAMDDDFNTAGAIGAIFEFVKEMNTVFENTKDSESAKNALLALDESLNVLGLLRNDAKEQIPNEIQEIVEQRNLARKNKDWATSDALRDKLSSLGYEIKDTSDGVKISKK